MTHGGSILQYRTLDDRGEQLLDQVESDVKIGSERKADGVREYFLPGSGSGEKGIEPLLARLDSSWAEHVDRLTPL